MLTPTVERLDVHTAVVIDGSGRNSSLYRFGSECAGAVASAISHVVRSTCPASRPPLVSSELQVADDHSVMLVRRG